MDPCCARQPSQALSLSRCAASHVICISQVHECFCVVKRGEKCAHDVSRGSTVVRRPDEGSYFNAGLLVIQPCLRLYAHMQAALMTLDLWNCPFAEQDFLNTYWRGAWDALPWTYNATKGLYACHRDTVWDFGQVRNVHFTMAKPWDLRHPGHKGFQSLNKLWWAAYSEPATLCRTLLELHRMERSKKQRTVASLEEVNDNLCVPVCQTPS